MPCPVQRHANRATSRDRVCLRCKCSAAAFSAAAFASPLCLRVLVARECRAPHLSQRNRRHPPTSIGRGTARRARCRATRSRQGARPQTRARFCLWLRAGHPHTMCTHLPFCANILHTGSFSPGAKQIPASRPTPAVRDPGGRRGGEPVQVSGNSISLIYLAGQI